MREIQRRSDLIRGMYIVYREVGSSEGTETISFRQEKDNEGLVCLVQKTRRNRTPLTVLIRETVVPLQSE